MRKPVYSTNADDVYQTRLTSEEKEQIKATLLEIKSLLPKTRKFVDKDFCYSVNGAIITAALKMYCETIKTYLEEHGEEGKTMGWFEKFTEHQNSLTIKIDGEDVHINDCMRCTNYNDGKRFPGCEACAQAALESGVMNMSWNPNEEGLKEMREYMERYGDDEE